jgi:hypothetical protein
VSDQPTHRPPSIVDVLARQALALSLQLAAVRATCGATCGDGNQITAAAIDALEAQHDALLETVRVMQDMELQRRAAATLRAPATDDGPKLPPVFGRGPTTAPALVPVPAEFPRDVPIGTSTDAPSRSPT